MKAALRLCLVFLLSLSLLSIAGEADDYTRHASPSDRLVNIMQGLFSVVHKENVDETTSVSKDDMADLIETVEELLFYAELMSAKVPATELEENESVIFSAMAGKLYDEALNIQQLANNYNFDIADQSQEYFFNEALERLNRTCAACHQLFRD